ncbi:MAG: outer membrane lipoprotein-sorting protein [Spirochaetia bacterium]
MKKILVCIWMLLIVYSAFAQSAEQIYEQAFFFSNSDSVVMEVAMTIHERRGDKERELEIFLENESDGGRRVYMQITRPGFLRNMKYLQHQDGDGSSQQWLRTSRGVQRLTSSNSDEPLFGSDFTVGDLSESAVADYSVSLEEETHEFFIIRAVPENSGSRYAYRLMHISKESSIIHRVDFYSASSELVKQYELLSTQNIGEYIFPETCIMRDLAAGTETELQFLDLDVDRRIPSRVFNRGNL